jgi:ArsR family transcriptional regulator
MDSKEIYKRHAAFCQLMSNPKRLEIIFLIGREAMCVDEIAKKMNVRIANVSQHLSLMRDKNVVTTTRVGTKVYYELSSPKLLEACTLIREIMLEQAKEELAALLASASCK